MPYFKAFNCSKALLLSHQDCPILYEWISLKSQVWSLKQVSHPPPPHTPNAMKIKLWEAAQRQGFSLRECMNQPLWYQPVGMLSRKCFCCHSCLPEGWRTQLRVRVSYSRDLRAKKEASIPERTHSGLHKNLPQRLYMISSVGYMSLISKELLIKIYEVGGSFMRQSGCSSHQNKDQVDCLFFFF